MKILVLPLLLISFSLKGQNFDSYMNTDKYTQKIFPSEFNSRFKNDEEKKNFKRLREFLSDKQEIHTALKNKRLYIYDDSKSIISYQNKIQAINNVIGKYADDANVFISTNFISINPNSGFIDSSNKSSQVAIGVRDLKQIRDNFIDETATIKGKVNLGLKLDSNINNIIDDIRACQDQIDSSLAPEYKQQEFRVTISICFSVLIGILLVVFFYIVYQKSDSSLSKELLSGNGLQFVTLFVLIIAIILFGILGILGSSELAAILSGISGYILGKGTQKST